jgi:hypothetical protein
VVIVVHLSEVTAGNSYDGSSIGREVVMVVQLSEVTAGSGYDG